MGSMTSYGKSPENVAATRIRRYFGDFFMWPTQLRDFFRVLKWH